MQYPLINIVIATLNSDTTLKKVLESIKKQDYPKNKIRVLIIDGGSVDSTKSIARKFKFKILTNSKTEDIFAKQLGFIKATGKFLLYLDSDEILENYHSLMVKYLTFKENIRIKAVIPSGYKTPVKYSPINYYINEFGDPFSFFMYKESKGDNFSMKDWIEKYKKVSEDENSTVFNFSESKSLPLVELCAGGCMIDLAFAKLAFPKIKKDSSLIGQLFYLINSKDKLFAVTKNDYTIHYSTENFHKYLKKISSRIVNNVYGTVRGKGGFTGREKFQSPWYYFKKYLFIPYSLSLIFPLYDSVYLSVTRKKFIYLIHPFLCLYTTTLIVYYYSLKTFNIKLEIKNYGH